MKASAAATCRGSSRVTRRTRTFVSTARMASLRVSAQASLQFSKRPMVRGLREQGLVQVGGGESSQAPNDDPLAVLLPFKRRARTNTELPADGSGNRDLSLSCEPRVRDWHTRHYRGTGTSVKSDGADSSCRPNTGDELRSSEVGRASSPSSPSAAPTPRPTVPSGASKTRRLSCDLHPRVSRRIRDTPTTLDGRTALLARR